MGAWSSFVQTNPKPETVSATFFTESVLNQVVGKKTKSEKISAKQTKKVNFEESEKETPPQLEGGRVTSSLVKVTTINSIFVILCILPFLSSRISFFFLFLSRNLLLSSKNNKFFADFCVAATV